MKLLELKPRWYVDASRERRGFTFLCPHCLDERLGCEMKPLDTPEGHHIKAEPRLGWTVTGNFQDLTVTPSIDASSSGHWHGFITNGEVS